LQELKQNNNIKKKNRYLQRLINKIIYLQSLKPKRLIFSCVFTNKEVTTDVQIRGIQIQIIQTSDTILTTMLLERKKN